MTEHNQIGTITMEADSATEWVLAEETDRTQMTQIVRINADFFRFICIHPNLDKPEKR